MEKLEKLSVNVGQLFRTKDGRKCAWILLATIVVLVFNTIVCQESGSKALSAFSSLTIFDVIFLASAVLTSWASRQHPNISYSYG